MKEFLSAEAIGSRVAEMGKKISEDYSGRVPILIGVLNGSFVFLADLLRELTIDCEVDFVKLSSYEGTASAGTVHLLKDISADITGRDVIVVEDIIDSGLTISFLRDRLLSANPATLTVATLLFKRAKADVDFRVAYVGFDAPEHFLVGYGLDLDQKKRNLRSVYILDE